MKTKICTLCKHAQPLSNFYKAKNHKDGLQSCCKDCLLLESRVRRAKYWFTARYRFSHLGDGRKALVECDLEEFVEWFNVQEQICYYCGRSFEREKGHIGERSLTIDRKDNNLGYSIKNMVLACGRCNLVKSNIFSEKQMLEIAHKYFKVGKNCP